MIKAIQTIDSTTITWSGDPNDDVLIELRGPMVVQVMLTVKNVGNTKANVVGQFYCDTTCQTYYVRRMIRKSVLDREFFKVPDGAYEDYEIMPGKTDSFPLTMEVAFWQNQRFVIHAVLFYENELNQLFDTYFHAVYEAPNLDGYITDSTFVKNIDRVRLINRLSSTRLIESPHKDSEPYSAKERDMIIDYFSKVELISKDSVDNFIINQIENPIKH